MAVLQHAPGVPAVVPRLRAHALPHHQKRDREDETAPSRAFVPDHVGADHVHHPGRHVHDASVGPHVGLYAAPLHIRAQLLRELPHAGVRVLQPARSRSHVAAAVQGAARIREPRGATADRRPAARVLRTPRHDRTRAGDPRPRAARARTIRTSRASCSWRWEP